MSSVHRSLLRGLLLIRRWSRTTAGVKLEPSYPAIPLSLHVARYTDLPAAAAFSEHIEMYFLLRNRKPLHSLRPLSLPAATREFWVHLLDLAP